MVKYFITFKSKHAHFFHFTVDNILVGVWWWGLVCSNHYKHHPACNRLPMILHCSIENMSMSLKLSF